MEGGGAECKQPHSGEATATGTEIGGSEMAVG